MIAPELSRYARIEEKNKREIVLLRGTGCTWRRCRFCDYHLDCSKDEEANERLNREVLAKVTGIYHRLEVINSGNFPELGEAVIRLIEKTCLEKQIKVLHIECHWRQREAGHVLRERFVQNGITVKIKTGVESFDYLFRESYLDKGIPKVGPAKIAAYFDEVCLLFGLPGQSKESMEADINTGLAYFERVCINIMQANATPVRPDQNVIKIFTEQIYPRYFQNERVDILMENTDFGVGKCL